MGIPDEKEEGGSLNEVQIDGHSAIHSLEQKDETCPNSSRYPSLALQESLWAISSNISLIFHVGKQIEAQRFDQVNVISCLILFQSRLAALRGHRPGWTELKRKWCVCMQTSAVIDMSCPDNVLLTLRQGFYHPNELFLGRFSSSFSMSSFSSSP